MIKINPRVLFNRPYAIAMVKGSEEYPNLKGKVSFYCTCDGTIVVAEIFGLPSPDGVFAMHIHNGYACTGNETDPFADAGTHLNLTNSEHPYHTGDLPALFSNNGYAWNAVFTNRFKPSQIKGHTVIIHAQPDDYHTQPSGNSGMKIACGIIK